MLLLEPAVVPQQFPLLGDGRRCEEAELLWSCEDLLVGLGEGTLLLWRLSEAEWCDWLALTPVLTAFRNFSNPPLTSSNTTSAGKERIMSYLLDRLYCSCTSQLQVDPFHAAFHGPVSRDANSNFYNLQSSKQPFSKLSTLIFKPAWGWYRRPEHR